MSLRIPLNELDERVLPDAGKRPMPPRVRASGYFLSLAVALLVPGLVRHETAGLVAAAVAGTVGLTLLASWLARRRSDRADVTTAHE